MHAIKSMSTKTILAGAIALAAACSGQKAQPVDAGLANDLSLASQAQAYRPQQYVSPQELAAMQAYGQPGMYPNGYVPQPIPAGYAAGPYYAAAPAPQTRVVYRERDRSRQDGLRAHRLDSVHSVLRSRYAICSWQGSGHELIAYPGR